MNLYGFASFVDYYLVPYEYASIILDVIEASSWLCSYHIGGDFII